MRTKEEYLAKAKELGIENAEALSWPDLQKTVKATIVLIEAKKEATQLGVEYADDVSLEAINELISTTKAWNKAFTEADELEVEYDEDVELETLQALIADAKNPKEFWEDENGNAWCFTEKTPKQFRFNNVIKTQEEWLKDETAMELLVTGNSSYIKFFKTK